MLNLTATTLEALDEVDSQIHDSYYDIEDVSFDAASGKLTIPLRSWPYEEARVVREDPAPTGWRRIFGAAPTQSWEAPWYRWFLRIENVESYELEDHAEIGLADFDVISYDEARSTVTIEGNLPITIEASVTTLSVTLEQTGQMLGICRFETEGSASTFTGTVFPASTGD